MSTLCPSLRTLAASARRNERSGSRRSRDDDETQTQIPGRRVDIEGATRTVAGGIRFGSVRFGNVSATYCIVYDNGASRSQTLILIIGIHIIMNTWHEYKMYSTL